MEDASWASTAAVRKSMQGNRYRDTKPELAVRRAAHALGLRYRVAVQPVQGLRRTADMVFPRLKVAVFVDGCFWHGCPEHYKEPRSHVDYWREKIAGNRLRDRQTTGLLNREGWLALRYWAHEDPVSVAKQIAEVVDQRRDELLNIRNKPLHGASVTKGDVEVAECCRL
ncbi:very short patch repair endonuclease [Pseudarthrobacter enclensis]|jgi:DNA mismatch endonuclease (patch repair protein)|uniref:very short patch repair endonuclease n=1 Tax=Pseudarthrobacter enclensis TaxID=993070 RepID=UPI003682F1B5